MSEKRLLNDFDVLLKRHKRLDRYQDDNIADSDKPENLVLKNQTTKPPKQDAFAKLMSISRSSRVQTLVSNVPGLSIKMDVIQDGNSLIRQLQSLPGWKPVGSAEHSRRVLHFGRAYNYSAKAASRLTTATPLPEILEPLRKIAEDVSGRILDQCLINQYLPGQGIGEHIDKTDAFGDTVVCFSLGSTAVLVFRHPDGRKVNLDVPPHSMYVMTGESRYVWSHEMPARMKDGIRTRGTRLSITFRNVKDQYK